MTDLYVAMSVFFCLPHPVAVSAFIICRGVCACVRVLRCCEYGCVAMCNAVLLILRSILLVYSAGSGGTELFCLDLV